MTRRHPARKLLRLAEAVHAETQIVAATVKAQQWTIIAQKREIDRLRAIIKGNRKE